jgi:hypothetical protein
MQGGHPVLTLGSRRNSQVVFPVKETASYNSNFVFYSLSLSLLFFVAIFILRIQLDDGFDAKINLQSIKN